MAKRPPPGRCVHCLRYFDELTWDHVFPEAWYPKTTSANLEKWKIPACRECNLLHSKSEGDLLIRIGLCVDPDDPNSAGIVDKVLRAANAREGKDDKDASRREALRQKILKEAYEGDEIPYQAIYPGFGPQSGVHDDVRVAIPVSATSMRRLVEKIVRGITYDLGPIQGLRLLVEGGGLTVPPNSTPHRTRARASWSTNRRAARAGERGR